MNTYAVSLPITVLINADNKYVALDAVIKLLESNNVSVAYYDDADFIDIDDYVFDLTAL